MIDVYKRQPLGAALPAYILSHLSIALIMLSVTAIQNNLRVCLEGLCYSLAFYNGLTQSGYELSVNFEDLSLIHI